VASPVRPRGRPRSRQRRPLASRACVLCRAPASAVPRSGTSSTSPSRSRACPQRDRPLDRILSVQQRRVRRRRAGSDDARQHPPVHPPGARRGARGRRRSPPGPPWWTPVADATGLGDGADEPFRVAFALLAFLSALPALETLLLPRTRKRRHGTGMSALIAGNFRLMAEGACPTSSSADTSGESAAGPARK
jgi:hypothetical protein